MAQLLVSVRSAQEALAALEGGAHLIDVKEPSRGSLGRADTKVVSAIVRAVAGRRPVSAALGELVEATSFDAPDGLSYVKVGLSGWASRPDWRQQLLNAARNAVEEGRTSSPVAVAYADDRRATAPAVRDVVDFARLHGWPVVLIDTWLKDGTTLLDWLARAELVEIRRLCHASGIRLALAGSLGVAEIERLRPVEPDWFAVRAAACRDGNRVQAVCTERVRRLVQSL